MTSGITMVSYERDDAVGIYGVSGGQLWYRLGWRVLRVGEPRWQ